MSIIHVSDKVGADDLLVRCHRCFVEATYGTDTDIADPDIDDPGQGSSPSDQIPHRLCIRDVGGDCNGVWRSQCAALLRHRLQRTGVASREYDAGSGTSKRLGSRLTDAA